MCQAKILLEEASGERLFMKDVVLLRVEGGTVVLLRMFEEPVELQAEVLEADFLKHTVRLRRTDDARGPGQ
jgi:predicted RNA-binding protein